MLFGSMTDRCLPRSPEASQMGAIVDAGAGHPHRRRAQEERRFSPYLPASAESTPHQTCVKREWFKHPQAPSTTLMCGNKDALILIICWDLSGPKTPPHQGNSGALNNSHPHSGFWSLRRPPALHPTESTQPRTHAGRPPKEGLCLTLCRSLY